jgi:hypothetical protein
MNPGGAGDSDSYLSFTNLLASSPTVIYQTALVGPGYLSLADSYSDNVLAPMPDRSALEYAFGDKSYQFNGAIDGTWASDSLFHYNTETNLAFSGNVDGTSLAGAGVMSAVSDSDLAPTFSVATLRAAMSALASNVFGGQGVLRFANSGSMRLEFDNLSAWHSDSTTASLTDTASRMNSDTGLVRIPQPGSLATRDGGGIVDIAAYGAPATFGDNSVRIALARSRAQSLLASTAIPSAKHERALAPDRAPLESWQERAVYFDVATNLASDSAAGDAQSESGDVDALSASLSATQPRLTTERIVKSTQTAKALNADAATRRQERRSTPELHAENEVRQTHVERRQTLIDPAAASSETPADDPQANITGARDAAFGTWGGATEGANAGYGEHSIDQQPSAPVTENSSPQTILTAAAAAIVTSGPLVQAFRTRRGDERRWQWFASRSGR